MQLWQYLILPCDNERPGFPSVLLLFVWQPARSSPVTRLGLGRSPDMIAGQPKIDPLSMTVPSVADVMYIEGAVAALVATLEAVSGPHTEVYVAHGRCGGKRRRNTLSHAVAASVMLLPCVWPTGHGLCPRGGKRPFP